ncbi:MAG: bifunctional nuclease family protein [Candidatus Margulisbacteria bacterium]|nr:bifunctional nuclease family protein [Candidatus Margulisiibacteriota bacterium]
MIEMQLGGLGFDPRNMSPIILLRDAEEKNFLPIWIGMFEAAAIAMELQDFKPPRPMTHDLLVGIIDILGGAVDRIVISDIKDDTFYSSIDLIAPAGHINLDLLEGNLIADKELREGEEDSDTEIIRLDARPSDAIAIAVRTNAPIFVSEQVMSKAKMVNAEKDQEETKKFKDFIENINPEDFEKYFNQKQ